MLIEEARACGAKLAPACRVIGLDPRTVQRWITAVEGDDMRMGPKTKPANSFTKAEELEVLRVVNLPEFRDLPPKQIVPRLADMGIYVASESTIERLLRREGQKEHRGPKRRKGATKPREKSATAPCQVWTWDITCLRGPVVGHFFYLYMAVDIWSRKIVGFAVFDRECSKLATVWLREAMQSETAAPKSLVVHQDNGAPMKGTLKATLENLGVHMSYSRPHVSDDNPYSESLFGTMKTRPEYPHRPFANIEQARAWCASFVRWYNESHRHSAIGYVTPCQRHDGETAAILAQRRCVYERAKRQHPERWSGHVRRWKTPATVYLNPEKHTLEMLRK